MLDSKIAQEIDKTLDLLIRNAEAISNVDLQDLSETELDAFQKTQESLLHHLLCMDQQMTQPKTALPDARSASARIRAKRMHFNALSSDYNPRLIKMQEQNREILSKRRKKRFFDPRYKNSAVLVPK